MRKNITSFADFALAIAIAIPRAGRLERQNIYQLSVHTAFAYGSCRLKNVFPGVSRQFQISPMKFQFQLPNESKSRQKNSMNKMSIMSYK